jgi:sacsin
MDSFEFGQKQPIHIAIRGLIHDYPQDEGILKELIQNADDGGASEIRFILDRTIRREIAGPLLEWSDFAREALIVGNDCAFSDADLENIQHISDSDKISRPGQTGRYGRGFNAVYNLTDTPLLLTGTKLMLFDPCRFYVGENESGKGWQLTEKAWTKQFPDALSIFESAGYTKGSRSHNGTIFRFPLRQKLKGASPKDRITEQKFAPETFSHRDRWFSVL